MVKLNGKADILLKFFVEGKSKRQIARETGKFRNTVRKYIRDHEDKMSKIDKILDKNKLLSLIESLVEKPKYDSSNRNKRKLTEEIIEEIKDCLQKNKKKKSQGKHKQLMKKIDIHDYLISKDYDISYSTVCNFIREYSQETKEAYINQGGVYKTGI